MKDNYGDEIRVSAVNDGGNPAVYLSVTSSHDDMPTDAALSPAKARKLAKKLRAAADEADPRPLVFVDEVSFDEHADEALAVVGEAASAYRLTLSQDEAETLAVILAKIGGPMGYPGTGTSARAHADSVFVKLGALGLDGVALCEDDRYATTRGFVDAIHFKATRP